MPGVPPKRISRFGNCLQQRDDASFADALPRKPKHKSVELRSAQRQRRARVLGPDEPAAVQAPCRQPDADAIVHQHLHAVGAAVREEVRMMRSSRTEYSRRPGPGLTRYRRACPAARPRATARLHGSTQQLAQPGCALTGGAQRPADVDGNRASANLNADVARRRRHGRRDADWHEDALVLLHRTLSWLAPPSGATCARGWRSGHVPWPLWPPTRQARRTRPALGALTPCRAGAGGVCWLVSLVPWCPPMQ